MASVHSVLRRLHESGVAKSKEAKDGTGTRFSWAEERPSSRGTAATPFKESFRAMAGMDSSALAEFQRTYKTALDQIAQSGVLDQERMREIAEVTKKAREAYDEVLKNSPFLK